MPVKKKNINPLLIIILVAAIAGGWFLLKNNGTGSGLSTGSMSSMAKQLYTCVMHPFITKEKPGNCPICGMDLIKKLDNAAVNGSGAMTPEQKQQAEMLGNVSLSTTQRVMANVATVEAKQQPLNKEINAVGIVQYDQSRQAKVTAWIDGRIDKLNVDKVGDFVTKGRPVAEVYSPDLVSTQQEYLLAVRSRDQLKSSSFDSISKVGPSMVQSAKQRLMLFGVKESQIAELEKGGKPVISIPIYTPISGVVTEKLVQLGQYLKTGDVLFSVTDFTHVWVEIEVYENEFPSIRIGQNVEINSPSYPGKPFTGKVIYIYPFLDPKTRTVKVRVELPNPGMKLKPEMFVNALIRIPLGNSIVVPTTAVMDTGKRQVIWVEKSPGVFQPQDVKVGQQTGDKIQILSGIKAGSKIAVSGGYLIDSESQLKGGSIDTMPGMKMDEKKPAAPPQPGHEGHGHGTPPSGKDSLKMDDMKM
jgi:Cu(I)/Ag(I) efflux system membrane fusion protein